jgi:hypothetical protein
VGGDAVTTSSRSALSSADVELAERKRDGDQSRERLLRSCRAVLQEETWMSGGVREIGEYCRCSHMRIVVDTRSQVQGGGERWEQWKADEGNGESARFEWLATS